jgi:hypothetical protein
MMELKQSQNKERNKFIFLRTQAFVGRDATTVPENIRRISTFRAKALHHGVIPDEWLSLETSKFSLYFSGS